MARQTTVVPVAATGKAIQTPRSSQRATGATSKSEVIVISDGDDDEVLLVPAPSARPKSIKPKSTLKAATIKREEGVKVETDVDSISTVLGGISLNGQSGQRVKAEPVDHASTPAKPVNKKVLIDLSYVSPFPTPAPAPRPAITRVKPEPEIPLFLPQDSDPESDWAPSTKKGKSARRIVRDPDSDSDDDNPTSTATRPSPAPSSRSHNATSPISVGSSPASTRAPASRAGPSSKPKLAAKKFFDLEAQGGKSRFSDSEDDEEELEEREKKWRMKHYDESLGSLKDFIVDDDYVSEEDDESEEDSEEESEEEVRPRRKEKGAHKERMTIEEERATMEEKVPPIKRGSHTSGSSKVIEISDSDSSVVHSDPDNADLSDCNSDSDIDALLHFSPPPTRLHTLPDLATLSILALDSDSEPDTPPRPSARRTVPIPPTPKTPASKKKWGLDRTRIAQQIFDELDRKVFESKLGTKGAGTKLEWNNRLLTTAGQAHSERTKRPDGTKVEKVKIILSEKVLTGEEQILSTVAHEMCHVASWIISDERKNPHGKVFQTWGRKVMKARPDIEVTTKHDYQIEYKFQWRCTGTKCDKIYKRHSKSIDIEKQACGRCRSKLAPMFETKKETAFQLYLRQNLSTAKSAMPGSSHGDVMRALSRQWAEAGPAADHQAHWSAMALAART